MKIETKICAKCKRELPISEFHKQSTKNYCKSCLAEPKVDNQSIETEKKRRNRTKKSNGYKLTELDKIAIECAKRGISYGQWQQEERCKKNGRA